ncbi:hypothetical protein PMAYCL1PPCAC_22649 [Pristionchus mayeri]|uniref:Dehydrogenase n=1 Tax=Pristionchus mayeri TaxID=1317129 RepID=A0AAN5I5Q3_9BILA|nr:hypothetical protein PMAYCL1PPCAC_22649 [Pristionchus mayeri]
MSFFRDKVVLVTGSSDGIGRAAAVLFAKAGARVTVTGRSEQKLTVTKSECVAAGAKADNILELAGDVTDQQFIEKLVQGTVDKFGRLDVLVNNAGAAIIDFSGKNGLDIPIDVFDNTMDLNVRSVVLISQLAIPHLEKTQGAIVNVSSIVSSLFTCSQPYYPMSKTCLDQLTVQMAGTLIKKGIRVNSVNPGIIRTNFIAAAGLPSEYAKQFYDKADDKESTQIPLGKCGVPDDIAKIIVFLADRSQSEIIVGQRIVADGGSLLKNNLLSADI